MIRLTVLLVSEDHTNDSSCFKVILANTTMWTTVVNKTWSGWVTELWNTRLQTTLERGGAFYFMAHLPDLSWEDFKSWERQYFAISSSTNLRSFFEMSQIRFTPVRQLLPTPATQVLWKNAIDWTMSNAHRASIASFPRSAKEKSGGVNKSPDFKAHVQQKHEIGFYS